MGNCNCCLKDEKSKKREESFVMWKENPLSKGPKVIYIPKAHSFAKNNESPLRKKKSFAETKEHINNQVHDLLRHINKPSVFISPPLRDLTKDELNFLHEMLIASEVR